MKVHVADVSDRRRYRSKGAMTPGDYSGGSMERPGLAALLADIDAGRIDVVVVYKVDRLTRSLADFARMVERFDARAVSFVSVTQAFNTTTSMGRLTLNVLLSFAQFEREVGAERVRDKVAASRKKGIWMGGAVPLGYRAENRKLVIEPEEAERVREIFRLYLDLKSMTALLAELNRRNIRTARRVSRTGRTSGDVAFGTGSIFYLLHNPVYVGEVYHKGEVYPGEHEPILDRPVFEAVQARLASQAPPKRGRRPSSPALLMGLIFDSAGNRMTPAHANKGGVRYRYYVSRAIAEGRKAEAGDPARVPAPEIEAAVIDALRREVERGEVDGPGSSRRGEAAEPEALRQGEIDCPRITPGRSPTPPPSSDASGPAAQQIAGTATSLAAPRPVADVDDDAATLIARHVETIAVHPHRIILTLRDGHKRSNANGAGERTRAKGVRPVADIASKADDADNMDSANDADNVNGADDASIGESARNADSADNVGDEGSADDAGALETADDANSAARPYSAQIPTGPSGNRASRPAVLTIPWSTDRSRPRRRFIAAASTDAAKSDDRRRLAHAIHAARTWFADIASGAAESLDSIARREGKHERTIRANLALAFLAPDLVEHLLDHGLPDHWTMTDLTRRLPRLWSEQRTMLKA